MKSLYLIDGHALAYRAYFAFSNNPLITQDGEETSAVFGFTNTVLSLLKKHQPSHLAVVFDCAEKTFRHEVFPEYKANREKMPDSLIGQISRIHSILEALSISIYAEPGFEADDILATIAARLETDIPVRIISGDKDLFQVISDRTHVIRPGKGGILEDEIDPARLQKRIGLEPAQVVDFLSLTGDSSDNVPGVKGVGEKTALKLLREFGSLDEVYNRLDSVKPDSLKMKLERDREQAHLSRELIVLNQAVPIEFTIEEMKRTRFQMDRLQEILQELELYRLFDSLAAFQGKSGEGTPAQGASGRPAGPPAESKAKPDPAPVPAGSTGAAGSAGGPEKQYVLVSSEDALRDLAGILRQSGEFALDVETSELDPMRAVLAGISFATRPGLAWYVPVASRVDETELSLAPAPLSPGLTLDTVRQHLAPVLADPQLKKIGQNIKYDAVVLRQAGFELEGVHFDTMLASYCLHPARRSHSLDSLSEEFFNYQKIPFKSLFETRSKKKDIRLVPIDRVAEYGSEDADFTLRLKQEFAPLIRESQVEPLFWEVEMPLSRVLTGMEIEGVKVDSEVLRKLSRKISKNLGTIEQSIYDAAGERFNINSTTQLQVILFEKLGLTPLSKTKTGYSTGVGVLQRLSEKHELPQLVLEYRSLDKLKSTYIDALPKLIHPRTGKVHTSYNQAVTTTGRLSSSNPNLQNIPIRTGLGREIRKAFVASGPGRVLLDADYSQVELRILAHLSQDAELCRAFEEDADIHRRTAARILGVDPGEVTDEMRSRAKTVNFGVIYGMGARGLAQSLGIEFKEAKQFIEDYFENYPGVNRFIKETVEAARKDGAVSTLLGRVRQLPEIDSQDRRSRAFAERTAVNTPVQGTAADIIKVAMVKLDDRLRSGGFKARMILQVHDELLLDLPEEELEKVMPIVKDTMETAIELKVRLKVDMAVGHNWLEAHG